MYANIKYGMNSDLPIQVGTTVKAVKYESGEPEVVEVIFRGKSTPRSAGYQIEFRERTYCAGYEMADGAMMLAFTF